MRLGPCQRSNLWQAGPQAPRRHGLRATVQAMLYRSRCLETLLGSPLDTVTYADLAALAGNL